MNPVELHQLLEGIDVNDDPAAVQQQWNAFLNELLGGARLHAVSGENPLGLTVFTTPDGSRPFLPVFSSTDALHQAFPNETRPLASMGLNDMITAVRAIPELPGITINPTTRALVLTRSQLEDLAAFLESGHQQTAVQEDTPMMVGDPAVLPQNLMADLTTEAARRPEVTRLWLGQMTMNHESSYLLVVDCPRTRVDAAFPALARMVQLHHELTQPVDFVLPSASNVTDAQPFYTRSG